MKYLLYTQNMNIRAATEADKEYLDKSNNHILARHQQFNTFYKPVSAGADPGTKEEVVLVATDKNETIGFIQGYILHNPIDR